MSPVGQGHRGRSSVIRGAVGRPRGFIPLATWASLGGGPQVGGEASLPVVRKGEEQ